MGPSRTWPVLVLLAGCASLLPPKENSPSEPGGAFVRTAAVLYGAFGAQREGGCYPLELGARFDLIVTDLGNAHRWCGRPAEPFRELKRLNPSQTLLLYLMGPTAFKTSAPLGFVGPDWDWIKAHHGRESTDRWTALGRETREYLLNTAYPVERAMELGNPGWQRAWLEASLAHLEATSPSRVRALGADGIFADGMPYTFNMPGNWCPESRWDGSECSGIDYHATYFPAPGQPDNALWQAHYRAFLEGAVARYREASRALGLNVWILGEEAQGAYRGAGEGLGGRLFLMQERGFIWHTGYDPRHWLRTLRALQGAQGYRLILVNGIPGGEDRSLEAPYLGQTGWDWLWFALTSYLLGYDPDRQNAYFHFLVFRRLSYDEGLWVDEYDPRFLHLGRPLGEAYETGGGVWLRPFQRGWVAVNPGETPAEVRVPQGRARVLDHGNFKNPPAEGVERFQLGGRRGVVLLR